MKPFRHLVAVLGAFALAAGPAVAADNVTAKDAASANVTMRCVEVSAGVYSCVHVLADHLGNLIDPATSGGQTTANTSLASILTQLGALTGGTATTTITRPADTTAYAANDALSDSTSAPTAGGFTLTSACPSSGSTAQLDTLVVASTADPATTLVGELWVFDSSVTAVNDNAAFALSDGDVVKLIGKLPFALETTVAGSGTNSIYVAGGLGLTYTCSGTANLRFLVKVKNAYTPISGEALTFRWAWHAVKP